MSKIVESKKIIDVLKNAKKDSLVIFDVDNTLINCIQRFGCSEWFEYNLRNYMAKGLSYNDAFEKCYVVLEKFIDLVKHKTVEPETVNVINDLHSKNIKTMAMTLRKFDWVKKTIKQLNAVNIFLNENTLCDEDIKLDVLSGYSSGIFCAGHVRSKGENILLFFEKINYVPKHVIFVDDSVNQVNSVHKSLSENKIDNVCIRYGATDEQQKSFKPAVVLKELEIFFVENKINNSVLKELV